MECDCNVRTLVCEENSQATVESAKKWAEHKADPSLGFEHTRPAGQRLYRAHEAHKKQEERVRREASAGQPRIERPWQLGPDTTIVRVPDRDSMGYKM